MKINNYIVLFLIFVPYLKSYAQEDGHTDSVWVSEQLEKGILRINPEYLKAMEDGTLINTEQSLEHAPMELSIQKDFAEYLKADSIRALQFDSLPPAVFMLYPVDTTGWHVRGLTYRPTRSLILKDKVRLGKSPFYLRAGAQNLYMNEVKDGQRQGTLGSSVTVEFSLENTLRYIFWKSERNKRRNREREFTWKHYNSYP